MNNKGTKKGSILK